MTLLETVLLYVGFGIVFLFFIAFTISCMETIEERRKENEKINKK